MLSQTTYTPRLSQILARILRDLYGIRLQSTDAQCKLAGKYSEEIETWRSSVLYLFDAEGVDPSLFQPIFLRQRNVLNLACWHAQILVHRPFLLNNFANLANLGTTRQIRSRQNTDLINEHVQKCLDAAKKIVEKIDQLSSGGQLYNTFWVCCIIHFTRITMTNLMQFSHYFAFSAVVILYVYAIQQRHAPPETYLSTFHAGVKCQAQISSIAIPGSLAQRYGVVLQELRLEVLRHNSHLLALTIDGGNGTDGAAILEGDEAPLGSYPNEDLLGLGSQGIYLDPTGEDVPGHLGAAGDESLGFIGHSPGSSTVQMTGWGQFDSLVRPV